MILSFRRYGFFISVLLLQAVYFFAALHFGKICNGDTFEYVYEAVNILNRSFFYCGNPILPVREEYMTLRPPGYPLFLAAIYAVCVNNWIVLFFQNMASLFNILLMRRAFQLLGYSTRLDPWFFLLLLLYPGQFVYSNVLAPDIMLQACCAIYFYYCIRFLKDKRPAFALYMSLALIAGLFIKPVLYPFVIIHLFIILIFGLVKKLAGPALTIATVLPLCCVLLYSFINKKRTGKFHFSSIQSVNALYNHLCYYYEKEGFEKGEAFIAREKAAVERLPTFRQRYDAANRRSVALLKENFIPYMQYHFVKSGMYFLQTGRGELDQFVGKLTLTNIYAGKSETLTTVVQERKLGGLLRYAASHFTVTLALFTFISNMLKLIGVLLFLKYGKVLPVIKWFVVLFCLYFALITGPVSNAHYVMPVSLVVMCCALTGYLYAFRRTVKTSLAS